MKISKYKKAMRPKKYLTHDFIVYKGEPLTAKEKQDLQYGDPETWNQTMEEFMEEQGLYKEKKDERE